MNRPKNSMAHLRRRSANLLLTATLVVLTSCTAATSPGDRERSASEKASPFTRLTDPGGCVMERVAMADHEIYQTQSVSPNGRWIAVGERPEGTADNEAVVYEMDLASGEKSILSHEVTNAGPYSPDSRFIVLAQKTANGKTDVFEYERATGKLRVIAAHEDWDWLPSYSPDGRYIAFNSYRVDGQADIYWFDKATGELKRISDGPGYEAHAQVAPDGKRILYHRQRGTRTDGGYLFDLIVYDLVTERETVLTNGDYEEGYPAWAPDGRHIVFSSDQDSPPKKPNLYVLGPSGEIVSRLTSGDWKDSYAYWSRDGRYIYFNSDRTGVTAVYRILMDGVDCIRAN